MSAPPCISPIALAAGREVLFEVLMDMADWTASHARSAAEAAWRGDAEPTRHHLLEARSSLIAALKLYRELAADGEKASAP